MSHTPHELADTFPDDTAILHRLKLDDPHFANLAEQYHTLNREIHRIESEVDAASDERAEELKKQRLHLADTIGEIVAKAREAAA